ncbi:unnamed protein product [Peniophora sp. CBMAI 1063]|nr:unnamed protein product [Peniophora sp. CBMAI 1063]
MLAYYNLLFSLMAAPAAVLCKPTILDLIADASSSPSVHYPTQLTQGIVPKPIHSHNDYWRDVPLLTALSLGVASVEADVWLANGTLFVGHEVAALTPSRTFTSLYVDPLLSLLSMQNPQTEFTTNQTTPNGVFDTSSATPLQLLVDMKTNGDETLLAVLEALEPLRSAGYLTTASEGNVTLSAVTVVGTGNTPLEGVQALEPRDIFFDAPLQSLNSSVNWGPALSPIASTDYETVIGWSGIGSINDTARAAIEQLVDEAHSFGIAARFWDTPGWPISARNAVWEELLTAGTDWLNADDLEAASKF